MKPLSSEPIEKRVGPTLLAPKAMPSLLGPPTDSHTGFLMHSSITIMPLFFSLFCLSSFELFYLFLDIYRPPFLFKFVIKAKTDVSFPFLLLTNIFFIFMIQFKEYNQVTMYVFHIQKDTKNIIIVFKNTPIYIYFLFKFEFNLSNTLIFFFFL